jgi:hypothetical protein
MQCIVADFEPVIVNDIRIHLKISLQRAALMVSVRKNEQRRFSVDRQLFYCAVLTGVCRMGWQCDLRR